MTTVLPTLLITGASGHIGAAFAKSVSSEVNLILVDRDQNQLDALLGGLSINKGLTHHALTCDLSDQNSRNSLVQKITHDHPQLNGIINNASFTGDSNLKGWVAPFEEQSIEAWRAALEVNLTAVFELCQQLGLLLRQNQDGHILNIASIYGHLGPDMRLYEETNMGNPAAYAASKGGLIQLTKWLATVLAPDVRVNCISPGGLFRNQPEAFVKAYEAKTPLGRMANEDDIVGAMKFLTIGQSQYITGQNLFIDGGFSIW